METRHTLHKADMAEIADQVKASPTLMEDEILAKKNALTDQLLTERKLLYIGRKSIAKYGCYGCHDIPGFEDAKTIGTGLANWGRKETSKLAFEHITQYLDNRDGKRWWSDKTDFDEDSRTFYEHALKAGHRERRRPEALCGSPDPAVFCRTIHGIRGRAAHLSQARGPQSHRRA